MSGLTTRNLRVENGKRLPLLKSTLAEPVEGGTLLFTNTREQCDKLARELNELGHTCVVYRGEMDKVERRKNLKLFREGKIPFLVSTDLASRGLDVDHVGRLIKFVTERDEAFLARLGSIRYEKAKKRDQAIEWTDEPAHKPRVKIIKPRPRAS